MVETLYEYLEKNNVSEDAKKLILGHKPAYDHIIPPKGIQGLSIDNYIIDASWKGQKVLGILGKLEKKLNTGGMTEDESFKFIYGIMEAVQNAQEHGYEWKRGKKVLVTAIFAPTHYIVGVYSGDKSIDLEKARQAIETNKVLRFGNRGRGFFFMDAYSDMLYLNSPDTCGDIILIKAKKMQSIDEAIQSKEN